MHRLPAIQSAIRAEGLDGWLLYDFKGLNPIALRVAGIPADRFISRRWACFIPAAGEPRWIAHAIEAGGLRDLAPGIATYISWQSWRDGLAALLAGAGRVAMEVSPGCAIPYVSRVDAGTVELVRSLGVEVATSADLVQVAEAVWTEDQLASHRRACAALNAIKDATFAHVRERLAAGLPVTECGVQDFMMTQFAAHGLETDHPPIVAVNAHAADPHFAPRRDADTPLRPGDFLLLDLWGREPHPDAIYGDITWVGYAGPQIPPRIQQVFELVRQARDAAVVVRRRAAPRRADRVWLRGRRCLSGRDRGGWACRSLHPPHRSLDRHERTRQRRQSGQPGNAGSPPLDPRRWFFSGTRRLSVRGGVRCPAGDQLLRHRGRRRSDHAADAGRNGPTGRIVAHSTGGAG